MGNCSSPPKKNKNNSSFLAPEIQIEKKFEYS